MKFILTRTSRPFDEIEIEINSLEELMKFKEKVGEALIISYYDGEPSIEIYDDWRE